MKGLETDPDITPTLSEITSFSLTISPNQSRTTSTASGLLDTAVEAATGLGSSITPSASLSDGNKHPSTRIITKTLQLANSSIGSTNTGTKTLNSSLTTKSSQQVSTLSNGFIVTWSTSGTTWSSTYTFDGNLEAYSCNLESLSFSSSYSSESRETITETNLVSTTTYVLPNVTGLYTLCDGCK